MKRRHAAIVAAILILLAPAVALAEVSVQLDRNGKLRKVHFLASGRGGSQVIWGQVRKYLPLEVMLNPLGDNLGDGAPNIALHPKTGFPWVVWSMNIANQKRIGFATWDGKRWTSPALVVQPADPHGRDQLDPRISFTPLGAPLLTWWVEGPTAALRFSTLIGGRWSPPLALGNRETDSRRPVHTLDGAGETLFLSYETPAGSVTKSYSIRSLLEQATSIMDNPIPPGYDPPLAPDDESRQRDNPPPAEHGGGGRIMLK
jgi:hypothetical protein